MSESLYDPLSREVSVLVEPRRKELKRLGSRPHLNPASLRVGEASIKIETRTGDELKLPIYDSRPEVLDFIRASSVQAALLRPLDSGRWVLQVRLLTPRIEQTRSVLGIDVGTRIPVVAAFVPLVGPTSIYQLGRCGDAFDETQRRSLARRTAQVARDLKVGLVRLERFSAIESLESNQGHIHLARALQEALLSEGLDVQSVSPRFTSQSCPSCASMGHCEQRVFICHRCGFKGDRDHVAALNIARGGVLREVRA